MRSTPPAALALLTILAAVAGCAPAAQVDREHVEPTSRTVRAKTVAAYSGRGHQIVIENSSTVDIVVTSLHLKDCENIRNRCEVVRLSILVPAGQSRPITTVERRDDQRASNFRYSWTWDRVEDEPA
jgi:hypothetical protein